LRERGVRRNLSQVDLDRRLHRKAQYGFRTLRIGDREEQRVVLAPVCDGRMTLMLFTRGSPGALGDSVAQAWLSGVQTTDSSPACEALKSLRDPEEK
jgi:hypothetical protein